MTKKKKEGAPKTKYVKPKAKRPANFTEWKEWFRKTGSGILLGALRYILLFCIGYIILLPILKMISKGFMSPQEVSSPVSQWIPSKVSTEHFVMAFKLLNYPKAVAYTVVTTALQVVLQVFSAAITGYAFARLRSKKLQALFFIVILTIVVPQSVLVLPQYLSFRNFDILGIIKAITGSSVNLIGKPITLFLLDFCGMGLRAGLYIFIFRQAFRGLPRELEEAAYIDGCSFIQTLFRVVVPNADASIITVGVLSFVWNWNDTFYTSRFVGNKLNLMVRLNEISGAMDNMLQSLSRSVPADFYFNYRDPIYQASVLSTASLLVILPLIILYAFIQKKFVESSSRAGIVG